MIVASFYAPRFEMWVGCDYDALLPLVDASCRHLGLEHVVLSDAERPAPLKTFLCALPVNLMQAVLEAQRQFLAATPGPVLLIGADCLLIKDPRKVLSGDITVTIGPFSDCPMNTGAVWVADGPKAAPVWQAALDRKPVEWGDDQRALYAAVKESGLAYAEIPAEFHNWAPEHPGDDAGMPTVVHFRGKRKAWMAGWWDRFAPARKAA